MKKVCNFINVLHKRRLFLCKNEHIVKFTVSYCIEIGSVPGNRFIQEHSSLEANVEFNTVYRFTVIFESS